MIEGVYNYLVQNYNPKSSSRTDIHKRSELRSIYNKIVNKGKTSPLYLVDFSLEQQTFVLGVKEAALSLNSNISQINNSEDSSSFHWKKASSTSKSVSVSIISDDYENLPDDFSIQVNQLAQAQENTSSSVYATSKSLSDGMYTFSIETDRQPHEFQFHVEKDLTNQDLLEKFKVFINKANIGIQASLHFDEANNNKIYMHIKSKTTGERPPAPFYFKDIDFPDKIGIVTYYGLNHITTPAENAKFLIDGEERGSYGNDFVINHSLNISLNYPTDTPVQISYKPDSNRILNDFKTFADEYNEMIHFTQDHYDKQKYAKRLLLELDDIAKQFKNELESVGITFLTSGHIKIDDALALQAIEDGEFQALFERSMGYTQILQEKMSEITIDPIDYIDKKIVVYPNFEKPGVANPYMTSIYSGMLFNYYC